MRRAAANLKSGFATKVRLWRYLQPRDCRSHRLRLASRHVDFGFDSYFACLAVLVGVALGGCAPGQGQSDDEKEPHFVLGKSRVNAMDYQGAIEAFEESLEVNPQFGGGAF